jgi:hypothetical protein
MSNQSDAELMKKIFPEPGCPAPDMGAAWMEFINRCQQIIVETFHQAYLQSNFQASSEDIYRVLEKTIFHLYQQDYKQLRALYYPADFRLAQIIAPIAITFILELIGNPNTDRLPAKTNLSADESKEK